MAATRIFLTPYAAEFPSSNFPQLTLSNQRPVLAFDASTKETSYWTMVAPQGLGSTLTAVIFFAMASATANKVNFEVSVEAITPADATDTDATTSFDSVNDDGGVTVPGTAGYVGTSTITLTNKDSIAAGDYVRISLARDAADGTNDTATGDALVFGVEVRDA